MLFLLSGKTTDRLISEEKEITENANPREHDVLVSTGEQITISKLAMLLQEKGYKAVSQTGWQIPIVTNSDFSNSRIRYINNDAIRDLLQSVNIVIVAGFQGVDENLNITTLGRGGSDTTAVALAASLKAERCDIFTDVDGVFVADPRIIDNPKKIDDVVYPNVIPNKKIAKYNIYLPKNDNPKIQIINTIIVFFSREYFKVCISCSLLPSFIELKELCTYSLMF